MWLWLSRGNMFYQLHCDCTKTYILLFLLICFMTSYLWSILSGTCNTRTKIHLKHFYHILEKQLLTLPSPPKSDTKYIGTKLIKTCLSRDYISLPSQNFSSQLLIVSFNIDIYFVTGLYCICVLFTHNTTRNIIFENIMMQPTQCL